MIVIENKTGFEVNEIIQIAKRRNNTKRDYLFVNSLQAKHIPAFPHKTMELFNRLGEELYNHYGCQKVGIIGFAETATAIGVTVASAFIEDTLCIHTTRENIVEEKNILKFEEEHSHAPNQSLYFKNKDDFFDKCEVIILVEDEISTGKTILNFLSELEDYNCIKGNHKIVAASLINAMDENDLLEFENRKITCHSLLKISYDKQKQYNVELQDNNLITKVKLNIHEKYKIDIINMHGKIDTRVSTPIGEYLNACDNLSCEIVEILKDDLNDYKSILILGTEEFMYPPIAVGSKIFNNYNHIDIKVHSTTRSPIMVHPNGDYPINNCSEIQSFYCKERQTYIYNLDNYDKVIIITDGDQESDQAFNCLAKELSKFGCRDILGIRWVK